MNWQVVPILLSQHTHAGKVTLFASKHTETIAQLQSLQRISRKDLVETHADTCWRAYGRHMLHPLLTRSPTHVHEEEEEDDSEAAEQEAARAAEAAAAATLQRRAAEAAAQAGPLKSAVDNATGAVRAVAAALSAGGAAVPAAAGAAVAAALLASLLLRQRRRRRRAQQIDAGGASAAASTGGKKAPPRPGALQRLACVSHCPAHPRHIAHAPGACDPMSLYADIRTAAASYHPVQVPTPALHPAKRVYRWLMAQRLLRCGPLRLTTAACSMQ